MRAISLSLLFTAAALLAPACGTNTHRLATASNQTHAATVTRNTDGDTLWLSDIGKVRLIGIDTPEVFGKTECFGKAASAFTKRVLPPGTHVRYRLGIDPRDRYGRALAYIYLQDGRLFNELLAERGYATPMTIPPNVDYVDRFVAAARRAREADRGLWRACS
jgi:micrococcal nuclease